MAENNDEESGDATNVADKEVHAEVADENQPPDSTDMEQAVIQSIEERGLGGGFAWVIQQYNPTQFNELVDKFTTGWEQNRKRTVRYRLGIILLTFCLIASLFVGLTWLTLKTSLSGESIVFFAGTLVGYFARLASEFY